MISRRRLMIGGAGAVAAGGLGWLGVSTLTGGGRQPLALVYRGPASTSGCPEAVATLLRSTPSRFRVEFCGPHENVRLSRESLAKAVVYAQPGGGELKPAWRHMREYATDIQDWVRAGGNYLGFCLGGYLAGAGPGFGLLPGGTDQYISTPDASVTDDDDTVIGVRWRQNPVRMYFQDGPLFRLDPRGPATVLATYDTGQPAAVVAPCGSGRIGVVGPHPEADTTWFTTARLDASGNLHPELGYDLIETTVHKG
ncbi:BPL-N domain-containing protein [Amycolatopsis pigmentata]|uniref:BPL-N domain-containing protein n=1 Tax=Amycolatopsis pigmentata TaxID=450801 RepID=A0ABW5G3B9_9PSEU